MKITQRINSIIRNFHSEYFNQELDINIRTMHLLILTGVFSEFIIAIVDIYISYITGEPMIAAFIDLAVFFFALIILMGARRVRRYELFKWICIIGLFMIVYPIRFFYGGGYQSGMSIIFLLALFYTSYILEKRTRLIVVSIQFTIYVACHIVAYDFPHLIVNNATRFKNFADMTLNFTVLGIVMLVASIQRSLMTSRQQAQIEEYNRELIERNKTLELYDKMKGDFLATVAHELNTPLAVIKASSGDSIDLLEHIMGNNHSTSNCTDVSNLDPTHIAAFRNLFDRILPEILENQQLIDRKVILINEILQDLIDSVAIEHGRLPLNRTRELLAHVLEHSATTFFNRVETYGNRLELSLPEHLPEIMMDTRRIEQVVTNLLSNAVRHTRNGVITIQAQQLDGRQVVHVSDTGEGMDEEAVRIAFKQYVSTKTEYWSHGIGLHLCQRIILAHGGDIWIVSEKEKGTTVTFALLEE